ncbi:MAG: DUF4402 domain-containing protein [Salegentibacter sp.]
MQKSRSSYLPLVILLVFFFGKVSAQENPPVPIQVEVRTSRNLDFGSFIAGASGGNVTVDSDGIRTSDGAIFELMLGTVSSALFDVYANPGTIIQIQDPGEIPLVNASGGEIYLTVNKFSTGRNFITTAPSADTPNEVFVGGTLRIPADNSGILVGKYNGTFTLTFINQ